MRVRAAGVGVATTLEPHERRSDRVADIEAIAGARQVSLLVPTEVPAHLIGWIEASTVDEAFGQTERHGGIVSPLPGLEPEWTTPEHVRDRLERAGTAEFECRPERVAGGEAVDPIFWTANRLR
jgi:hypothetical protein